MISNWPDIEFGLHIHTTPGEWYEKIEAAWESGCRSFDGVLSGIGGCPMTGYEMIGNLNTLDLIKFIDNKNIPTILNKEAIMNAMFISQDIYEKTD